MICKHCRQLVDDYDAHFPNCPKVRIACDDTYWVGLEDPRRKVSAADRAARHMATVRNGRARARRLLAEARHNTGTYTDGRKRHDINLHIRRGAARPLSKIK
jgi:hypothetical protein